MIRHSPVHRPAPRRWSAFTFSVNRVRSFATVSAPSASAAANTEPAMVSDFHTVFNWPGARSPFSTRVLSTMVSKAKPASQSPAAIESAEASCPPA
ncbi:Uncharacterised protein [Mycobacteroides abscessus subsp. abscessus]|nr:Uncharacterised protein [Mycobacteroides abscessus subsp. abscessus]